MKYPQRKAKGTHAQEQNKAEALECQAHRGQHRHKEHSELVRSYTHFPRVGEPKPSQKGCDHVIKETLKLRSRPTS